MAERMRALQVFAGPRARAHLRSRGLAPGDVRVVPAAAGGPKGLVLLPLDRYLFGQWLAGSSHTVHLLGASIGAWRMAAACRPDAEAALAELGDDYIRQTYDHEPGEMPTARCVSEVLGRHLAQRLGPCAAQILSHPHRRLHVFTSRGRHLLHRPGPTAMALGWLGATVANALSRRALGGWLERVVFSDPRDALPLPLTGLRSHRAELTTQNLALAVLASCSIPYALEPVQDVPGGPGGTYWDGGITDYHLHLDYAALSGVQAGDARAEAGLVLYPHFIDRVIPGWLDKAWKRRHGATPALDNVVLLAPHPQWVRTLPGGKLPDRRDFKRYGDDEAGRQRAWRTALAESERLADEFAQGLGAGHPCEALPLI